MDQLVVQTAFPGDLLLSIPLLKQIRVFYPKDRIVLLCRGGLGDFFLRENLVDEVIEVNKKDKASARAVLSRLREQRWKRIFCPHESYRSAVWVRSLLLDDYSVGFAKWWNFLAFSERVRKPKQLPDALRQLSLLRVNPQFKELWNNDIHEIDWVNSKHRNDYSFITDRPIPEWASMTLASVADADREKKIFIAPGSVWPTKRWTDDGFIALAQSLAKRGFEVVFIGSPGEKELCDRLAADVRKGLSEDAAANVQSIAGKTSVYELVQLFKTGTALIANDSGAMHAASVAGLPTVAIFGPTVLEFGFRPWQTNATVVQLDLSCRPCAAHGSKRCPVKTHACMQALPASQVESALSILLRNIKAPHAF